MNKLKMNVMNKCHGQIAVVLLLFVLVALTIGLAVTQRSLSNITTSSQSEQVSRAFSAAEAGIEKSVNLTPIVGTVPSNLNITDFNNQSSATVKVVNRLPRPTRALEYPPIGKDTIAQFWLADPNNLPSAAAGYQGSRINVYFGNNVIPAETIRPALEVNLIYQDSANNYVSSRNFFDATTNGSDARIGQNGFAVSSACNTVPLIYTSNSRDLASPADREFLCRVGINFATLAAGSCSVSPCPAVTRPIMLRIRVLYSDIKQPVAVEPVATSCGSGTCSLPEQAAIYSSTGAAGQSQKTLQVFRETNFLPSFLDFAIFSSGAIDKQ